MRSTLGPSRKAGPNRFDPARIVIDEAGGTEPVVALLLKLFVMRVKIGLNFISHQDISNERHPLDLINKFTSWHEGNSIFSMEIQ